MTDNDTSHRAHDAPAWLREIDHTGDVGLEVSAKELNQLFARAAWGMFSVLTDMDAVEPRAARPVTVEARDREALMVRWLSELNFLHVTQGWLFCEFEVQGLNDQGLVATARGELYDPNRHALYTEIKAITFHELKIQQRDDTWHVRVIFDL